MKGASWTNTSMKYFLSGKLVVSYSLLNKEIFLIENAGPHVAILAIAKHRYT